jgi:hypothetical protein
MVMSASIRKAERFQANNLPMHLTDLEKQEQTKPKFNRMKEITKIGS